MSTTFSISGAAFETVPCEFCEMYRSRGDIGPDEKCDKFCSGTMEVSTSPEMNLSNSNAAALLGFLGFSDDLECGSASVSDLLRRMLRARNKDAGVLVTEPSYTPGGDAGVRVVDVDGIPTIQRMGAAVYYGGRSLDQVRGYLSRLDNLCQYALEKGYQEIYWG